MTSKSMRNKATKVSKNPERARAQRRNFEVIKHFDPSSNACSLYAKIPIVNVSDEEETKVVDIQVNPKRKLSLAKKQGLGRRQQRITQPFPLHHNAEGKKPKPSTLQGKSSSSLEKSINLVKMRSKTFHLGNPTKTLRENKALKSVTEKSLLKSATSSLKSAEEGTLTQRELNLRSLKQEILENKKNFPYQRDKLESLNSDKNDSLVKDLKAEILNVKTNNFLHKKMLITELRSEISQYKQFNKFPVYKSHEGNSRNPRPNCSVDSKKPENSYVGDEDMKNYDSKDNTFEKGSMKCGLNESKEASFGGKSETSNRGANAAKTDIDSTADLIDRPSESTVDPVDIPKSPIRIVRDAESVDDEVIKLKIAQTDRLLNRVKKALVRIKSIKPCDEFAIELKSSSADAEETIDSLRKEAENFITENRESKSLQRRNKSRCLTSLNPIKNEENDALKVARAEEISFQVTKVLTADVATEMSNLDLKQTKDTQTSLEMQNFKSQEIFSLRQKCCNCSIECFPVIEIMPSEYVRQECEHILKHEDLQGGRKVSVGSKVEKVKKLKIQKLPPIIIKPALTLIQTLNLSIDPIGKSKNLVRNTDNLLFVETKRLMESQMEEKLEDVEKHNNFPDQELVRDKMEADGDKEAWPVKDVLIIAKEINPHEEFVNKAHHSREIEQFVAKPLHSAQMEEEDIRRKQSWYKSYNNCDNLNKHNPEELDKKSLEKPSEVDAKFYKTLVNLDPKMCEELKTSISKYKLMGSESKTVQCDQEMILAAQESCKTLNKITIDLLSSRANDNNSVIDVESEANELRMLREAPLELEVSPPDIIHSPTEDHITLPISYSLISENKIDGNLPMITNTDIDNKVTNSDGEELIASDVEAKAKSNVPNFPKRGDFLSDSSKSIERKSKHTIDYWLNKPAIENSNSGHLELSSNGTSREEEHLLTHMSYLTAHSKYLKPRVFQYRDLQVTNDKFSTIPQHQLRKYPLDISNSDTVTTNSISEGEVLCKHSVSNGEVHVCDRRLQCLGYCD